MSLRDQVAKFFAKPKPDARADLNTAASGEDRKVAADKKSEDERKTATAVDAKQAELLRTDLTPELTIFGTQPLRPPSDDEARARAEQQIAGKDRKPAVGESKPKVEVKNDGAPEKADDIARLQAEEVTPAYIAEIITLQAGHEVDAAGQDDPASWTPEERAAKVAEQVAIIEAEEARAALTHTTDGGKTM